MGNELTQIGNWGNLERSKRQDIIHSWLKNADAHITEELLKLVRAPEGYGVFASAGLLYRYAIFGRDSIAVADDLLPTHPQLAHEIILLLAKLQGTKTNPTTEEEPGKIHHEYRSRELYGHPDGLLAKLSIAIFERLSANWGGTSRELCYYGSFDATPLFVRLVYRYCALYGGALLHESFQRRDGTEATIRESVHNAAKWIAAKIEASPWHLLEYKRLNPLGLYNQSWEDSNTSYLHTSGQVANADGGIAPIELQGYAYDALIAAADLQVGSHKEATHWRELAHTLQQKTLELLWMPDEGYFAIGIDRDNLGATRHIATLSVNPAILLATGLLADMPKDKAQLYVQGIAQTIMSPEFLTDAGPRLRARRHAHLLPYADYHGSYVTWPKATSEVAQGLHRHGFHQHAIMLEDQLLQAVLRAGEFYEFFLVNTDNQVKYHYRLQTSDEPQLHDFGAANQPEPCQAWTISATMRIVQARNQQTGSISYG